MLFKSMQYILKIYDTKCCYTKLIKFNPGTALTLMIIKNERKKEGYLMPVNYLDSLQFLMLALQ